ncbi:MAG: MATE family efflux transporter [Saprospiraceae bacterium]|nr:MATE family efflux transporter [Saprospiraceae bacterium]
MSINKEILRLAIPNILSNISIPLLSTVDTVLVGNLSASHIGAVGLGAMIFNFIYWNFGFLRMGTTGLTAQSFGKSDDIAITETLSRALILALILALIILLLQSPLLSLLSWFLNVDGSVQTFANEYFFTRVWAAPATFMLYGLLGWYFGMQNAIIPLILTLIINVANIIVSWVLVKHFNMDVKGVALGTVVAQYLGLLFAFLFLFTKYRKYMTLLNFKILDKLAGLKTFLKINTNIFIRTMCLTIAFGFFYSISAKSGAAILASNVILLQFTNWMSYGIDGFAYASESLVGKYYGAKDATRLKKSIQYSLVWGFVLALIYSFCYYFFGFELLSVFTNQMDVIETAGHYLSWMAILPIVGFGSYIWDGVFIGFTAGKAMRNSMLISLGAYILSYYIFKNNLDAINALWLSLSIFLLVRGFVQTYMYLFKEKYLVTD